MNRPDDMIDFRGAVCCEGWRDVLTNEQGNRLGSTTNVGTAGEVMGGCLVLVLTALGLVRAAETVLSQGYFVANGQICVKSAKFSAVLRVGAEAVRVEVIAGFWSLWAMFTASAWGRASGGRRYMNDLIIIAKARWKLRRTIAVVQRNFKQLRLPIYPQENFMGRIWLGRLAYVISFLGHLSTGSEFWLSSDTLRRHHVKARQLYEQCKTRQRQAARVFADVNTIAGFAPPELQARAHIKLTAQMRDLSYADVRRCAYDKRFLACAH